MSENTYNYNIIIHRSLHQIIHEIIKQQLEPDRTRYDLISDDNWNLLTDVVTYMQTSNHRQNLPNRDPRWYLEKYNNMLTVIFNQATEDESKQAYELFYRAKAMEKNAVRQIAMLALGRTMTNE